jgi:hypothetical protein
VFGVSESVGYAINTNTIRRLITLRKTYTYRSQGDCIRIWMTKLTDANTRGKTRVNTRRSREFGAPYIRYGYGCHLHVHEVTGEQERKTQNFNSIRKLKSRISIPHPDLSGDDFKLQPLECHVNCCHVNCLQFSSEQFHNSAN